MANVWPCVISILILALIQWLDTSVITVSVSPLRLGKKHYNIGHVPYFFFSLGVLNLLRLTAPQVERE